MMVIDDDLLIYNEDKSNYVALGNFDGLHLGHLSLIRKTVESAKINNCNSMVFTYKNHPKTLVSPDKVPKLIMDMEEKIRCLEKENIDIVVLKEFTKEFMAIEPEEFIDMLCIKYKVKGIIVGFNFRFGNKNKGNIKLLEALKERYGYELFVLDPFKYKEDLISSTKIRENILNGNLEEANNMLSRPYSIKGEIIHGKKLGRTIGFPTANLKINHEYVIPKIGVYYTNIEISKKIYKGITSVGYNPTVKGKQLTIETFILDFSNEIYGEEIRIYFVKRIRDEIKFDTLDELIEELKCDKKYAENENIHESINF